MRKQFDNILKLLFGSKQTKTKSYYSLLGFAMSKGQIARLRGGKCCFNEDPPPPPPKGAARTGDNTGG